MAEAPHFEPQMSEVEALMWNLEDRDPRMRSTIVIVTLFDGGLDFARVSARVEHLRGRLPRFGERIVASRMPGVPPRWEQDPAFDHSYHLRRIGAPPPSDWDAVLSLAEPLASESFDKARPPWQMLFVEGITDSRSALIVKLHHTLTDGIGAVRLGSVLFDLQPDSQPDEDPPPLPAPAAIGDPVDRLIEDVTAEVRRGVSLFRQAGPLLAEAWQELRGATSPAGGVNRDAPAVDDESAPGGTVDLLRSAIRLAAPTARPLSTAMTGRSLATRLAAIEVPLSAATAVANAAGGTINDVYLAAVTAGLERYHHLHRSRSAGVRLAVPISTRTDDSDASMRNQVSAVRVVAPFGMHDAHQRIRHLHDLVAGARSEPALSFAPAMAGVANRLPWLSGVVAGAVGSTDVVVSNVPGSPVPLYLAGVAVRAVVGFGPRAGAAVNLTMVSHDGTLHIGVNADPAAAADLDVMVECLQAGFSETLGAPR